MDASYEARDYYIYIKVIGRYSIASTQQIFREWMNQVKKYKIYKAVCDLTQVIGLSRWNPIGENRFNAGELIALFMPKNVTLAILSHPGQVDLGRLIESIFKNRGIRVKVTQSLEDALKWLKLK
ncbi:MAG: hypothetical protein JW929_08430 [Anaerolineales bacterium]|nr:hypothetical protein [Anaerolineales bacterium]